MSKKTVIQTQGELLAEFRRQLEGGGLPWASLPDLSVDLDANGSLRLNRGKHRYTFRLLPRLAPARRDLEAVTRSPGTKPTVVLTVRLSSALVQNCRQLGLGCVDLNGRAYLNADGLLIDRPPCLPVLDEEFVTQERPPDLFSTKSSRLIRVLLSLRDRTWKQADLVALTGLNGGLVSRLLNHLVKLGWVTGSRGDWRLQEADSLLDAWRAEDDWSRRGTLREYATLERDTRKLAGRLTQIPRSRIAFTQWFAAGLRYPYADVPIVSAYREVPLDEEQLAALDLREVAIGGGRVWIIVPRDAGVFQVGREVEGLPLVSDVQIYLDLLQAGLRGPDQAKALREWSGFCQ